MKFYLCLHFASPSQQSLFSTALDLQSSEPVKKNKKNPEKQHFYVKSSRRVMTLPVIQKRVRDLIYNFSRKLNYSFVFDLQELAIRIMKFIFILNVGKYRKKLRLRKYYIP